MKSVNSCEAFLLEIAWCLYIVSRALQRRKTYEPFDDVKINPPRRDVGTIIYNRFNLGSANKSKKAL